MAADTTLSLHSHTVYSQRDAIIKPSQAAQKIKDAGGTHYSVTDHGTIQGWIAVRDACQKAGVCPVYGNELYVNDGLDLLMLVRAERDKVSTKMRNQVTIETVEKWGPSLLEPEFYQYLMQELPQDLGGKAKKLLYRLAYGYTHLCAVALTHEGRRNLIRLSNLGWTSGYYIKPQVTTKQCLELAEGIIWTSACLGGPIAKRWRIDPTGALGKRYLEQWAPRKGLFFLEVQPLDSMDQRLYNQHLIDMHHATGHPLVLSQDNHHLEPDDWIAHRILMLAQNDEPIEKLEAIYNYGGKDLGFSDLKKALGKEATWEVQQIIEQDSNITLIQEAGHHYGDCKLHWRTNDDVRKQCEITNPELLPYLDQCFALTDQLCQGIPDLSWDEEVRIPRFEDTRTKVLTVCANRMAEMGLQNNETYVNWLKREDRVLTACDFYDYIWTLYLLTDAVQREGIPIGYARGSGGGCLIMYLLGIIRVDPVQYGLFFDRFLNPARLGLDPITLEKVGKISSFPDVDLDFSSLGRKRVIEIAKELFGEDRVVPVGTIGEAKIKTAFQDLCRVMHLPKHEFMPVSKEIPDDPSKETTMDDAFSIPIFFQFCEKYPVVARFLEKLVGTHRSNGQHAGGVCIADVPIAENLPVVRAGSKDGGEIVTGFGESGAVRALESIGYIKFDCLATDTVDHVSLCARLLHESHVAGGGTPWGEQVLYPEQIPTYCMDDPKVMQTIFYTGNTDGVFQFEETIGKQLSALVRPDTVLEVSDISTMIRPGCLQAPCAWTKPGPTPQSPPQRTEGAGLHFLYAATKFHKDLNPPPGGIPDELLEVLEPSHYCCIYQEQMMFLIQRLTDGKMSLGEGDLYRRRIEHMGKNKEGAKEDVERLEAQMRELSPYPPEVVDKVTTIIKGGANYSFNKSHALSYSLFSYAQAWFKCYYPHIFFAAHLTLLTDKGKLDKVHKLMNNAKAMGLEITAPHVKASSERASWSADGKTIYLPLTLMKGIKSDVAKVVSELGRSTDTLADFLVAAMKHPNVTKTHVTALARVGALDNMGFSRLKTIAIVTTVWVQCTTRTKEEKIRETIEWATTFQEVGKLTTNRLMQFEVDGFGGFINHCPLDENMISDLEDDGWIGLSEAEPLPNTDQKVYLLVTSIQKKTHKSGVNKGKEWYKLICWDGKEVCDLSIWAFDLDDQFDDRDGGLKRRGYRDIVMEHRIYKAWVQVDGDRPTSLGHRHTDWQTKQTRDTLVLVPIPDKVAT